MKKETLKRTITDRKSKFYGKTFSIEKEMFIKIAEGKEKNMRRNNNRSTYKVITDRAVYLVTLERLRNSNSGCPRFNANLIVLQVNGEPPIKDVYYYTENYTFMGHFMSDFDECIELVRQREEKES